MKQDARTPPASVTGLPREIWNSLAAGEEGAGAITNDEPGRRFGGRAIEAKELAPQQGRGKMVCPRLLDGLDLRRQWVVKYSVVEAAWQRQLKAGAGRPAPKADHHTTLV